MIHNGFGDPLIFVIFALNVMTIIERIAIEFGTDIPVPHRMK